MTPCRYLPSVLPNNAMLDSWPGATLVRAKPELAGAFASLEACCLKLLNGTESNLAPRTNNTVELVIRSSDQRYQNFYGFDSPEAAQRFLGAFETVPDAGAPPAIEG